MNRLTRGPLAAVLPSFVFCGLFSVVAPDLAAQGVGISSTMGNVDRTLAGAGSAISFSRQVAPILSQHCGNCHIRSSKGDFSMASFARLSGAQGVVSAGNPNGSKLVTLIESGDMPPKGKVPAADLTTIKKWVQAGAAFDGNDRNASLASLGKPAAKGGGGSRAGSNGAGGSSGRGSSDESDEGDGGGGEGYGSGGYYEEEESMEEEEYGPGYGDEGYGSGSGGRGGRATGGASSEVLNAYAGNLVSSLGETEWSALFAPAPPEMPASGPVLMREAEQAFGAGNCPIALELAFGHMAAEYPQSIVGVQTAKYSGMLKRPVWNIRFGVSMSVRGSTSADPEPIQETTSGRRVAQAPGGRGGRGGRGGGGQFEEEQYEQEMEEQQYEPQMEEDYGSGEGSGRPGGPGGRPGSREADRGPQRTMLDADVREELEKNLGLVAKVVAEEFTKRFQQGDFGPALSSFNPPPEPVEETNRNGRQAPDIAPSIASGAVSGELAELLGESPQPLPMWVPGIIYLGQGTADEITPLAKSSGLDLVLHFDVVLKAGRNETMQNISRCRLIFVPNGKSVIVSKGMDSREADKLAQSGRSGEREYVEDQLAGLFAFIDRYVKTIDLPPLTPAIAKKRIATLISGPGSSSLRTLAEIRLYQAQQLIDDAEVETAFDIVGGPEALMLLHGPLQERALMARKWALRSQTVRPED